MILLQQQILGNDTDTGLVPIKVTIPEYAGDYESADASREICRSE